MLDVCLYLSVGIYMQVWLHSMLFVCQDAPVMQTWLKQQPQGAVKAWKKCGKRQVVYMTAARGEPLAALAKLLHDAAGGGGTTPCGIVYTARREDAEAAAGRLRSAGALAVWG